MKRPHIVIDLLPAIADGSNGGNLLFVLNLINYMHGTIKNQIIIISSRKTQIFLKKSLSFYSPNYKTNKIKFLNSYLAVEMFFHSETKKISFMFSAKSFINNFFGKVINHIQKKLNALEIIASKLKLTLKKNNHAIFRKAALDIIFRVGVITITLIKKLIKKNPPSAVTRSILFSPFGHFDYAASNYSRIVSIIYDQQHKDLPFLFSAKEIKDRDFHYSNIVNVSTKIITISNFSKERIHHFFDIEDDNVKVIHLPPQITKNKYTLAPILRNSQAHLSLNQAIKNNKFFFIPANFWDHKNHKTLLVAINMFTKINQDISFIFSGKFTSSYQKKEFDDFLRFNNLKKRVFMLDYISSDRMILLYSKCLAVISPSLYEGFGMTLVEAKFFCKVAIVSNIDAHKEIADPTITLFFDPRDPKDILEKLIFYLHSDKKNYNFSDTINPKEIYQKYINEIVGELLEC